MSVEDKSPVEGSISIVSAGSIPAVSIIETDVNVNKMKKFAKTLDDCFHGLMTKDTDFGTIPGTPKPTLYKSGAEILCAAFNLRAETSIVSKVEDYDTPFFDYTLKVSLYSRRDLQLVGDGVGSANTGETRYSRRWVKGSREQRDATRDEIMTLKNTVLKMAEKRAFVDATLRVTGASRIFTQDVEDLHKSGLEDLEDDSPPRPEDIKQTTPIPQKPAPPAPAQTAVSRPPASASAATQRPSFGKPASASVQAPAPQPFSPQPPAQPTSQQSQSEPSVNHNNASWFNLKWTAGKLIGFPIKKADGPIYYQFLKETLTSTANASGFSVQFITNEEDTEIKKILTTEMDETVWEEVLMNLQLSLSHIFKCKTEEVSVQAENYTPK